MFCRHLKGCRTFSRRYGRLSAESVLGMSSNEKPREISPYRRGGHVAEDHEVIVTLDPNKFVEKKQQRLCIGNQQNFSARISLHNHITPGVIPCISYDRTHRSDTRTHWPYPPDTKGFLYYTTPPEKPRIAGELRLRVTSSDDPASFASGSDLLRTNGQPWSRPLYVVSKLYIPLYQKLREDKLIPDDLDSILSIAPNKNLIYSRSQVLYTLSDTFTIEFGSAGQYFCVITEQGVETLPFRGRFFDNRESCGGTPYTGSAIARFERSTLPAHRGTRTIVLRFLKIITPVQCVIPLYDGYIARPKEGELHHRIPYPKKIAMKSDHQVWSVDIDNPKGLVIPGLRLLWDA